MDCRAGPVPCFVTTIPLTGGAPVRWECVEVRLTRAAARGGGWRLGTRGEASEALREPLASPGGESRVGSPPGEETLDEGKYDGKLSGHPDCPRVGSRGRRVEISMGGTIPFVPAVSTGKPVTVRCQWLLARTRAESTSSAAPAARERACQGFIRGALTGKWARREGPQSVVNARVRRIGGNARRSREEKTWKREKRKCLRLCRVGRPSGTR